VSIRSGVDRDDKSRWNRLEKGIREIFGEELSDIGHTKVSNYLWVQRFERIDF
jgi:hypothetical protein